MWVFSLRTYSIVAAQDTFQAHGTLCLATSLVHCKTFPRQLRNILVFFLYGSTGPPTAPGTV